MAGQEAVISARDLCVRYSGVKALQGVEVSIQRGSFLLVGGRSGSGKSTLAQVLLGLLTDGDGPGAPQVSGYLKVAGLTPADHTTAELATHVGLVFQNPSTQLFNGTVEEEVAFGPRNLGLDGAVIDRRVSYALGAVSADHLRRRSVRHLSGGEQQRIAIAATLAMRPSTLILDEPTANLDSEGTASIVDALVRLHRQKGITVVVIEHRLQPFLPYADRLIWLEEGRIGRDGDPRAVLREVAPSPLCGSRGGRGGDPLVTLDGVTLGYNGRRVLDDCSFTLREGELAALIGPNGSGKSTVARALTGLQRPWKGEVVWHKGRRKVGGVGFVQQNPLHQLVCDTVDEEVQFAARNLDREDDDWLEELLTCTGLTRLRQRPTQALSVGEQQRTALSAVLSMRPEFLILDEPTIGQDRWHLRELMRTVLALNHEGHTVLLITHDRELVTECAARVFELRGGHAEEI